jgi:solute carrier family 25 thiamine pyrophosphate transporter 19
VTLASWEKFCAGVAAGSAAKLALHPLDVAKKRLQVAGLARSASYGAPIAVGAYRGVIASLAAVARAEGIAGLYKGLLPNVLKAAPASGITFVVYEGIIALAAAAAAAREQAEAQRAGEQATRR